MSEPAKILIVDDERLNLVMLKKILSQEGHEVLVAQSGEEALDLIEENEVALVLLDVQMEGMDGFETASRLRCRKDTHHTPIIFVTGVHTDDINVFKGYESGAVDYLIKPVEPDVLKRKVQVFVDLYLHQHALKATTRKLTRSVSRLERSKEALVQSEQRYRIIADYSWAWEMWMGPDGQMLYVSLSCERITGYPSEKFMEDPSFIERFIHKEDLTLWRESLSPENLDHEQSIDFRFFRKDGKMRWLTQVSRKVHGAGGEYLGVRISIIDITHRKQMEIQLRHQALHDPLTGLANRTFCLERIRQAVERARRREQYYYALVFTDLDRFKVINDSFGHSFGDQILREVGERLLRCVRSLDTVSRYGGDEFVVLLEELTMPREAIRIVKRMREFLREPFVIDNHEVRFTASFGIVLGPSDHIKPEGLLQHANIAMYRAKRQGADRLKVFNSRMLEQAVHLMTLENDLRRALTNEEFYLVYQPIVDLKTTALTGFEALIRWQHPEKGFVGPGEFIPVAEESGAIVGMGLWVLKEACSTMASWRKSYPHMDGCSLSVNISAKQFSQPDLVDQVKRILAETDMPPSLLKLEITETTIMEDPDRAVEKLNRIRNLGVSFSVDDFGTGYSSMSYLQRFPLDNLKIDLSFVKMIDISPENIQIVKGIVNLAHTLKLAVVAEGVEKAIHQEILASLGCDYGQGFYFSRPIPKDEVANMLKEYSEKGGVYLNPE